MAIEKGIVHRPGAFKQTNKEHKHGRHRSKGSLSVSTKGKASVKTISKKIRKELNKNQRRHQALQLRQKKRDEALAKKRCLGGLEYAPFLVCVVPLCKNLDCNTALNILIQCDGEAIVTSTSTGVTHICVPRFKQRFSLIKPQIENQFAVLDTLKVSDTALFLISAATGLEDAQVLIDEWGNTILASSFAQGLPTPVVAVTDLESIAPKKRHEHKQFIQKLVNKWLPKEKVMVLDKNVDGVNLLRRIGNQKRKSVLYRDRRPHIFGEEVDYVPDEKGTLGTLKITGYLRGTPLSANQLVHLPGLGDFQLLQIDAPDDPNKMSKNLTNTTNTITTRILERCNTTEQESLDSECVVDAMDAEQTWPTNEEIEEAEREQEQKKKRVPKGWRDYQAAWIVDGDTEFQNDESASSEEEESDNEYLDAMSEDQSETSNKEDDDDDFQSVTESEVTPDTEKYDKEMDFYAEKEALKKLKDARLDQMFPDEVDTPMDQPARIRFQKYRGLESFRTSPWDPKENLPSDYDRIFYFQNFDNTKKRVLRQQEDVDGALPGWYVTVHVKDVSQLLWESFQQNNLPIIIIGLLSNEHKMSVVNTVLKRTHHYSSPIKSKERLIFQCGYRRFAVNPIFSAHTNGQKHKFERFFQPEATVVATFYGRILFPPAPVLCFKEVNNNLVLVATGNVLSCNPDRLVIKRVVLSGHPLKINKRSAVIRFMFFNREDINYFKSCKLRTKMGRKGHIKEALGTHGHMKCVFDGQLKSQDTVLLSLYKRIFPKWTFEDLIVSCNNETMETA